MPEEGKIEQGKIEQKIAAPGSILMFANASTPEADIRAALESRFRHQPWTPEQGERGKTVTDMFIEVAFTVIRNVPPWPTRTRVLNDIETCRMMANAAITHDGKF